MDTFIPRNVFQFHSGSIKSFVVYGRDEYLKSFNSIVVRLKERRCDVYTDAEGSFNSIVVRLKARDIEKRTTAGA